MINGSSRQRRYLCLAAWRFPDCPLHVYAVGVNVACASLSSRFCFRIAWSGAMMSAGYWLSPWLKGTRSNVKDNIVVVGLRWSRSSATCTYRGIVCCIYLHVWLWGVSLVEIFGLLVVELVAIRVSEPSGAWQ